MLFNWETIDGVPRSRELQRRPPGGLAAPLERRRTRKIVVFDLLTLYELWKNEKNVSPHTKELEA